MNEPDTHYRKRNKAGRKAHGPRIAGDLTNPNGFAVLLIAFLDWTKTLGLADATVKNRRDAVNYFIDWCSERDIVQPNEVTRPILERYRRHVSQHQRLTDGKPLSLRGQVNRLSPLKVFFSWLSKQRYILSNPAAELELPKGERRLPKHILTRLEVELVINQCNVEDPLGIRDRAILETLYSTGMRRMELIHLKLDDLVKRYIDAANLGKQGSCHLFRHSMATLMLENGADIRYIQAILGHEDLSTTQLYTHIAINKLKEVHTLTHPARLTRHETDPNREEI